MTRFLCALLFLLPLAACSVTNNPSVLLSPDQRIEVHFSANGPLTYSVTYDHQPLLADSRLGLQFQDGSTLGRDVRLVRAENSQVDYQWLHPLGKRSLVRDRYNEIRLVLQEKSAANRPFEVLLRAYDDGVAIRYVLPQSGPGNQSFVLERELTEFAFADNFECYAGEQKGGFHGSQEWEFPRKRLAEIPSSAIVGCPVLVHMPNAWVALGESDLRNWAGMWFTRSDNVAHSPAVSLHATLAPRLDHRGLVVSEFPTQSPWRMLMIAPQPGALIESDLVLNLASPCELARTNWIKPGMMAWDAWWSTLGGADTQTYKTYIQFASDMHWPYQLVDGGWYAHPSKPEADVLHAAPKVDMPELLQFAREKNVRLWLWLFWTDIDKNDTYKEAFALYEKWGIAGVKIDFMDRDDQEMVSWYEKVTREAAKHHLLVDFHGAMKPTGMIRTFPNQVTREGILSNEYNKWSTRITPQHKLMLPFTRLLLGPADFTPGGFINRQPSQFDPKVLPVQVQGTRASELALFIAYESPVICAADHPSHYRNQPGIEFLKSLPTVWDDTKVLSAAVGEELVIARRHGKSWYVAAISARNGSEVKVPLTFLEKGSWQLKLWRDAADSDKNAEHLETEDRVVSSGDPLAVHVAPNGGFVAILTPRP